MSQHTKDPITGRPPVPGRQESPRTEPKVGLVLDGEMPVRMEVPGYGGVTLSAAVEGETEEEDRPLDGELKIKVPGYGRRVVGIGRYGKGAASGTSGPVRLRVPGYGSAPLRMTLKGTGASASGDGISGRLQGSDEGWPRRGG